MWRLLRRLGHLVSRRILNNGRFHPLVTRSIYGAGFFFDNKILEGES